MRILHVLGKLDRGGVETWLLQLLRHIDRRRYQMDFLVHAQQPGAYDHEVRSLGSRIIPCPHPRQPLRYCPNFCRALRQFGPYDVVDSHVHHFSGVVLTLSAVMGVRIRVAHAHSSLSAEQQRSSLGRSAYLWAMRHAVAGAATGGLAVSHSAGDAMYRHNWNGSGGWMVSHLGIDLARFDHPTRATALRRELGIPDGSLVVGHVGRFESCKNHEFLVKIASQFVSLEPRAHFLLIGDGRLRPSIENKIRSAGLEDRFHLPGLRDDVPRLMCGAMDLFLFPSHFEGLPIALLEAQAAGLPCLVSDTVTRECDTVTELIEHESLKQSAEAWAQRLYALAGRRRMAPSEVRARLSYWSIEASAGRLLNFYEQLAQARARGCAMPDVSAPVFKSLRIR